MTRIRVSARIVIVFAAGVLAAAGVMSRTAAAFNPQPDPPAFGLVTIVEGQGIRVNVVCSEHGVGRFPPDPCFGDLMFHDIAGNTLATTEVKLMPGQATSLLLPAVRDAAGPIGIDPCWIPAAGSRGHAIPSAEVFNLETGRTMLFLNPASTRLSDFAADAERAR
jgi:hypothetical protein